LAGVGGQLVGYASPNPTTDTFEENQALSLTQADTLSPRDWSTERCIKYADSKVQCKAVDSKKYAGILRH
jgi:hypothetical protein